MLLFYLLLDKICERRTKWSDHFLQKNCFRISTGGFNVQTAVNTAGSSILVVICIYYIYSINWI